VKQKLTSESVALPIQFLDSFLRFSFLFNVLSVCRREEYNRLEASSPSLQGGGKLEPASSTFGDDETYLKDLNNAQFAALKFYYPRLAVWGRVVFVFMTFLSLVYDMLLLATLLYFHNMVEKLVATAVAIGVWFITYRFWFVHAPFPVRPGVGLAFKCDTSSNKNKSLSLAQKGVKRKPTLTGANTSSSSLFADDGHAGPFGRRDLARPDVLIGELGGL
jgi:hypothetical protein